MLRGLGPCGWRVVPSSSIRSVMLARAAIVLVLALLGCHPSSMSDRRGEAGAAMQAWHYRASVGPRAATVDVQLCFTGEPSALLMPGTDEAADYVEEVRHVGHDRS